MQGRALYETGARDRVISTWRGRRLTIFGSEECGVLKVWAGNTDLKKKVSEGRTKLFKEKKTQTRYGFYRKAGPS